MAKKQIKSEAVIQAECLKYLRDMRIYHVRIHPTRAGQHDTAVCLYGKFVTLEFKTQKGKPSKLQEYNGALIEQSQGSWHLIRSLKQLEGVVNDAAAEYRKSKK